MRTVLRHFQGQYRFRLTAAEASIFVPSCLEILKYASFNTFLRRRLRSFFTLYVSLWGILVLFLLCVTLCGPLS